MPSGPGAITATGGSVALCSRPTGRPSRPRSCPSRQAIEPIGEPFDIGAHTVVALPAGDYRLRVKATGLMSQTYRVAINRGETRTHHLTLDENRLLGDESIPFSIAHRSGHADAGQGRLHRVEWTKP